MPEWVADAAQRSAAMRWAWRWTRHATLFHLIRTPKYGVRAGYYAPRGGIRALVKWVRWLLDWDAASLRLDLIQNRDAAACHRAARHRDDRVKNRAIGSLAAVLAAAIGGAVTYFEWPLAFAAAAAAGAGALVWQGRPVDAPFLIDRTVLPTAVTRLTSDVVARALGALGIAELKKAAEKREIAFTAALDPTCQLYLFDGKGMGDYVMFEQLAHLFLSGSRTDTLLHLRGALLDLKEEVERRADLLTELTRQGKCREGKVTPELARIKSLRLHPVVFVLDECHLAFDTGSGKAKALGEEITELAEYLVRVGPAAGVSLVAATQRPDSKSLPTGIRANVQYRFCLRVADQPTNDMVLGTSAYKNGARATEFTLNDKGIGYLSGEGTEPIIMRSYFVDADQATAIVARARRLREDAGTWSGMAAGFAPARRSNPGELLMDVLAAMVGEDKMWSSAICERLAEAEPARYTGWDAATLGKALKGLGVTTGQVWWKPSHGKADNRNGVTREQISEALAALRATNDQTGS